MRGAAQSGMVPGMVGSHRKTEATLERLRQDGFSESDRRRIVTPIGLAIDARPRRDLESALPPN